MHMSPPIERQVFISSIDTAERILEIGPFSSPTFVGPHVKYFDIMSADEIRGEAAKLNVDPARCPETIHYVARLTPLAEIPERFDVVYSSHTIEHTLDFIQHLQDVSRILRPGGRYFLAIPDKRFTFDYFKDEATIGGVIDAHERRQSDYSIKTWIDRAVKSTHSVASRHWSGDHGVERKPDAAALVAKAIAEYKSGYRYPMVPHMWCLTPEGFREIVTVLFKLDYIDLRLDRVHETRSNSLEFYAALSKPFA